jgi:hypothetical protein
MLKVVICSHVERFTCCKQQSSEGGILDASSHFVHILLFILQAMKFMLFILQTMKFTNLQLVFFSCITDRTWHPHTLAGLGDIQMPAKSNTL